MHQFRVWKSVQTSCRIDTSGSKVCGSHVFLTTVMVCIRVHYLLFCSTEQDMFYPILPLANFKICLRCLRDTTPPLTCAIYISPHFQNLKLPSTHVSDRVSIALIPWNLPECTIWCFAKMTTLFLSFPEETVRSGIGTFLTRTCTLWNVLADARCVFSLA